MWKDLALKKIAPRKWRKASASARDLVCETIYKKYPFLALADNDWKLDYIAGLDYPGWVRRYLDNDGNYIEDRKTLVKQEDISGEEDSSSGKRKSRGKSEVPNKKIKGALHHLISFVLILSILAVSDDMNTSTIPQSPQVDDLEMTTSIQAISPSASSDILINDTTSQPNMPGFDDDDTARTPFPPTFTEQEAIDDEAMPRAPSPISKQPLAKANDNDAARAPSPPTFTEPGANDDEAMHAPSPISSKAKDTENVVHSEAQEIHINPL